LMRSASSQAQSSWRTLRVRAQLHGAVLDVTRRHRDRSQASRQTEGLSLKPRVPSCAQHGWGGRNLRRPEDW
jgi:hypothetical protein